MGNGEVRVAEREAWCKRVAAWPKGTPMRAAEARNAAAGLGISLAAVYQMVAAYAAGVGQISRRSGSKLPSSS